MKKPFPFTIKFQTQLPLILHTPSLLTPSQAVLNFQAQTSILLKAQHAVAQLYTSEAVQGALPLDFYSLSHFSKLKSIRFTGLRSNTSYKARLLVTLKDPKAKEVKSPFVFFTTKLPSETDSTQQFNFEQEGLIPASHEIGLCESERMLCDYNKETDGLLGTRARVLEARKTRGWKEYVKKGYKICRPRELADERSKRARTVGEAALLFEGDDEFLQNEWFQGPFYSYDLNFKG